MHRKYGINNKHLFVLALWGCFSCTPDEDACFETVCYDPDGTECVKEPILDSTGCFAPAPGS
ncbi:MAG: hypothetical protein WBM83_05980 [Flavobacteriaceae bacterium]